MQLFHHELPSTTSNKETFLLDFLGIHEFYMNSTTQLDMLHKFLT